MTIETQIILALAVVLVGLVCILLVIMSAIWEHVHRIEGHLSSMNDARPKQEEEQA